MEERVKGMWPFKPKCNAGNYFPCLTGHVPFQIFILMRLISYTEFPGCLASPWLPGETLVNKYIELFWLAVFERVCLSLVVFTTGFLQWKNSWTVSLSEQIDLCQAVSMLNLRRIKIFVFVWQASHWIRVWARPA